MSEKLRFTGEWPSLKYWNEYPNWDYALEEEGEDDQDETTLKPADVQDHIATYVAFTAGDAECANGVRLPALLEIIDEPSAVNVFVNQESAWRVVFNWPSKRWIAYIEDWLPPTKRGPEISMDDPTIFPLIVKSRLPRCQNGAPYNFAIYSDGTSKDLS